MMKTSEIEQRAAFDRVRYAQCWEDADVLVEALDPRPGDVCLSIASAGDNSLALLTRRPARVIALDLSEAQLHCLALRVAAYRCLDHGELLELIGARPSDNRRRLFVRCQPELDAATVAFWEACWPQAERWGIGGVGKFESYFRLFRRWVLPLVHGRGTVDALLAAKSADERRRFYGERWDTWRWRLLLKLFFSRTAMGRLGRDPEFFRYVEESEGGVAGHVGRRVAHALQALDPADNPYLQWILTGGHTTALPLALRPEHFATIREQLDRLEWRRQSVEDFADSGEKVDAFNLSDIFEYMSAATHEALYRRLLACARSGARLAYWNMLVPRSVPVALAAAVDAREAVAARLHASDKAFFYSRFVLEVVK